MNDEQLTQEPWIAYELSEISLGDKRLNWRVLDTATKLARRPSATINQACEEWADTKASYRLFANEKTTAAALLAPHHQRTKERMAGQERCLVIQDTTLLDYSHHPSKVGLGPLAQRAQSAIGTTQQQSRGLVMHSALATTVPGVPLGVLSQRLWSRDEQPKQMTADERRKVTIVVTAGAGRLPRFADEKAS